MKTSWMRLLWLSALGLCLLGLFGCGSEPTASETIQDFYFTIGTGDVFGALTMTAATRPEKDRYDELVALADELDRYGDVLTVKVLEIHDLGGTQMGKVLITTGEGQRLERTFRVVQTDEGWNVVMLIPQTPSQEILDLQRHMEAELEKSNPHLTIAPRFPFPSNATSRSNQKLRTPKHRVPTMPKTP